MSEAQTETRKLVFTDGYAIVKFGHAPSVVAQAIDEEGNAADTTGGVFPLNASPVDPDPHRASRQILMRALNSGAMPDDLFDFGTADGPASALAELPGLTVQAFGTIAQGFGKVSGLEADGVTVTRLPEDWHLEEIA